jgi:hypothetical protein
MSGGTVLRGVAVARRHGIAPRALWLLGLDLLEVASAHKFGERSETSAVFMAAVVSLGVESGKPID